MMSSEDPQPVRLSARWIIALWVTVWLFDTVQSCFTVAVTGRHIPWWRIAGVIAPEMIMWALLTPLVIRLVERFPTWKHAPVHLAAFVVGNVLDATLYTFIDPWINPFGTRPWIESFARYASVNLTNYAVIVAVALVLRYAAVARERSLSASRLAAKLSDAQLQTLQAQLRPHFLFNTLNAIAELVHRDPVAADRLILRLGSLLRRSFANEQEVTLSSELAFVRDYAEIVCARFESRIAVSIVTENECLNARVPALLLQPLVENAVRHGLEPRDGGGSIEVRARRRVDVLEIEVCDDGLGVRDGERALNHGVGLRNTRDRLELLYGSAQRFSVRPRVTGGTIVALQLPYREAAAGERLVVEESAIMAEVSR